jgi:hypothetical protein
MRRPPVISRQRAVARTLGLGSVTGSRPLEDRNATARRHAAYRNCHTPGARPVFNDIDARRERMKADVLQRSERLRIPEKWAPAIYFVFGQLGWFACVLGAAHGLPWIGILVALVLIALHLLRVARPLAEVKLIATVVVIGGAWENTLVALGLLAYPGMPIHGWAPAWLPALWGLFAAQANTTYQWLKKRRILAAPLGAIAGPLSFHAGAALGALYFLKPWPAVAALGIGWAVLLPLLMSLADHWDGVQGPAAPRSA